MTLTKTFFKGKKNWRQILTKFTFPILRTCKILGLMKDDKISWFFSNVLSFFLYSHRKFWRLWHLIDTYLRSKKMLWLPKKKILIFTPTIYLFEAEIHVAEIWHASKNSFIRGIKFFGAISGSKRSSNCQRKKYCYLLQLSSFLELKHVSLWFDKHRKLLFEVKVLTLVTSQQHISQAQKDALITKEKRIVINSNCLSFCS